MRKKIRKYYKSVLAYGFLVSVPAALAEWSSFAALVYMAKIHYLPASVGAFVAGTTANALLSRRVAFGSRGRSSLHETLLIYGVSILTFALNAGTLALCVEWLKLPPMSGKIVGTGAAFFANYAIRQFYIFSSDPRWK